jgi:hypothetical protein
MVIHPEKAMLWGETGNSSGESRNPVAHRAGSQSAPKSQGNVVASAPVLAS